VTETGLPKKALDLVVMVNVVHCLADPVALLMNAGISLKPDGPSCRTPAGTTSIGHQHPPKAAKTLARSTARPMIMSSLGQRDPMKTLSAGTAKRRRIKA
jgi:hypothetical protein